MRSPFGPIQLGDGYSYSGYRDQNGVSLQVYGEGKKVGNLIGHWALSLKGCQDDARELAQRFGLDGSALVVTAAELAESHRGRGLGVKMYEAMMAEAFYGGDASPFFFAPMYCRLGSGTSKDADRVWDALARKYPSSGPVIAVTDSHADWPASHLQETAEELGKRLMADKDLELRRLRLIEHPGIGAIAVDVIEVLQGHRGRGDGTMAMREILKWADRTKTVVYLTPDGTLGTPRSRLDRWYKRLGFRKRPSGHGDFQVDYLLMREPLR